MSGTPLLLVHLVSTAWPAQDGINNIEMHGFSITTQSQRRYAGNTMLIRTQNKRHKVSTMKEEGIDYNSIFCQIMRHYSALYDKKQQQQLCLFVRLVAAVLLWF